MKNKEITHKVKVLQVPRYCGCCNSWGMRAELNNITEWDEVSDNELGQLKFELEKINAEPRASDVYLIVEQKDIREVFGTINEFLAKKAEEKLATEREKEERAKARAEKALKKKRKQLEKLQEELRLASLAETKES